MAWHLRESKQKCDCKKARQTRQYSGGGGGLQRASQDSTKRGRVAVCFLFLRHKNIAF